MKKYLLLLFVFSSSLCAKSFTVDTFKQHNLKQLNFDEIHLKLLPKNSVIKDVQIIFEKQSVLMLLVRLGSYPNYAYQVHFFEHQDGTSNVVNPIWTKKLHKKTKWITAFEDDNGSPALLFISNQDIEYFNFEKGTFKQSQVLKVDEGESIDFKKNSIISTHFFKPTLFKNTVILPCAYKMCSYRFSNGAMKKINTIQVPMFEYGLGNSNILPLELNFSLRQSAYMPNFHPGTYQKQDVWFVTWLDRVFIADLDSGDVLKQHVFSYMSEKERNDQSSNVLVKAIDLNKDGFMDFIVNKSTGSAMQMKTKSYIHMGSASEAFGSKKTAIAFKPKKASGLIAYDVDQESAFEMISASANFNAWAMIKAFTKKKIDLTFSIFNSPSKRQVNISENIASRKITFDFDLKRLQIKGILPNIDYDFNQDGLKDIFYASNRSSAKIILQNSTTAKHFDTPIISIPTSIAQRVRLSDLNKDDKADIVLFGSQSKDNRQVKVLLSR